MKSRGRLVGALVAAAAFTAALPAAASAASTIYVGPGPTNTGGISCADPGYNKIQDALNAAPEGATITVCTGTYVEQLQITKGVKIKSLGSVIVKLPAKPANSTTTCDTSIPGSYQPNQDLVSICTKEAVSITGVTFIALWPPLTCYDSLYGLFVGGGGTLALNGVAVEGAGDPPPDEYSGCQGGVAIQLGSARTSPAETTQATLKNVRVTDYQKNGIDVAGKGTTATISAATVIGSGPTEHLAQNGIEVAWGGLAHVTSSHVSGDECNLKAVCGANPISDTQSTGVLLYGAAEGTTVTKTTVTESDIGIYYEDEETSAPGIPQVSISKDVLTNDRYEGVALGQGYATINNTKITGGQYGIALLQYGESSYGAIGTGTGDTIKGLSSWAVAGLSDHAEGDHPGQFTISYSGISGNPAGSGVTESVHTESPSLNIFTSPTDH